MDVMAGPQPYRCRIPVREALRQLEAEGLVTILPNRGAVVPNLSIDEVIELLDIRIALESGR
jgi:DNA-binding GntR family transcriptional regulator